jgi:hypothetical protein
MKITKRQLRRIIREEKQRLLKEQEHNYTEEEGLNSPSTMRDVAMAALEKEYKHNTMAVKADLAKLKNSGERIDITDELIEYLEGLVDMMDAGGHPLDKETRYDYS